MNHKFKEWVFGDDGSVGLCELVGYKVAPEDVIVPLGAMSVSLAALGPALPELANGGRFVSVLSELSQYGLCHSGVKEAYPENALLWLSGMKLLGDCDEDVVMSFDFGFGAFDSVTGYVLPAEWTGINQGLKLRLDVSVDRGGRVDVTSDVRADFLLWYEGHGRFAYYVSAERDRGSDMGWFVKCINDLLGVVDVGEDVEGYDEYYYDSEIIYHSKEFLKSFRGDRATPVDVVMEICRIYGLDIGDLERAVSAEKRRLALEKCVDVQKCGKRGIGSRKVSSDVGSGAGIGDVTVTDRCSLCEVVVETVVPGTSASEATDV